MINLHNSTKQCTLVTNPPHTTSPGELGSNTPVSQRMNPNDFDVSQIFFFDAAIKISLVVLSPFVSVLLFVDHFL